MALIDPAIGFALVSVFGITNIVGMMLVILSCRCFLGMRGRLSESGLYMGFYRYHCYYWWFFIASVMLHTVTAFLVFASPFA